jgi:hypothetical protein
MLGRTYLIQIGNVQLFARDAMKHTTLLIQEDDLCDFVASINECI